MPEDNIHPNKIPTPGDLLIDDDEDMTAVNVDEENVDDEEEEEELVDEEAKEEPNKTLTVKFGQVSFSRPSCRNLERCCRTDLIFLGKDTVKKETPVAKAEPTPMKQEPPSSLYSTGHPGFSPLMPGGGMLPGAAAGMLPGAGILPGAGAVLGANGMFRGPQLPTSVAVKPESIVKIEPSAALAQAKIMELFQQQEAAAKFKVFDMCFFQINDIIFGKNM